MESKKETFSLAYSPCPNDTFIFDNWVNGKLTSNSLHVSPILADVEQLNAMAKTAILDVTKISFGAFPFLKPLISVSLTIWLTILS
jgi:1,4-dihydroxy-6-naphthoate synthase